MRHRLPALVFAVALTLAACSSTVTGTAVKATGGPDGPAIDFDQLDPGRYPTKPREPLGVAGDPSIGVVLEAQRMANSVIGPWEVDPALTGWFGFGAVVLAAPEALALIGPAQIAAAASRHNFVNAFASARTEANKKVLLNAVLRFADEAAASAAANDMGEAALGERGADGPAQKLEVPGHPDTKASGYTAADPALGRFNAVRAFTAHGPYVLMQLAQSSENADAATQLVAKAVDLQGPEIDKFRATDPSEFADISIDPTGLLARTIPVQGADASFTKNTTYEQRGALHFQSDPARSAKLFTDTGVDLNAMAATNVYQARDADGAKRVVDEFSDEVSATSRPANPVKNLPDSHCLGMKDGAFYCVAPAGRYAIESSAPTLLAAQQMTAAQYIMLMSS